MQISGRCAGLWAGKGQWKWVLACAVCLIRCDKPGDTWSVLLPRLGTHASPRAVDLTGDGVMDIVMGAGHNEFEKSDSAVVALDGKTGALLWSAGGTDQIVSMPCFLDITGDQVPDVLIGGRRANFMALDGKTGAAIWRYTKPEPTDTGLFRFARFNFYTPQLIPDQTGDGLADILVTNGGNVYAQPGSTDHRYPGLLMVMDSKTGQVLRMTAMPDSAETYMSPLVGPGPEPGRLYVYVGTGGETIGGHLYRATLEEVLAGNLSDAEVLLADTVQGFVAPPILADLTGDGVPEVIAANHKGWLAAVNGRSGALHWRVEVPGTEATISPAIGMFTRDSIPDFFINLSVGAWPENLGGRQIAIDGQTGALIFQDSIGCTGFYSPIVFDSDGDGLDEALISVNDYNCFTTSMLDIEHYFAMYDPRTRQFEKFSVREAVKNISSTPWAGDLDQDGYLDLVYCLQANTTSILTFLGISVTRYATSIKIRRPVRWGAYMGSNCDGIYHR
ncbi:MAG: PQQ-binding-like beta-propeller repeat protein [Bacteroidia bacterium]|nr:PQQ-binding-like beta-propeller repeat protein [Bacteroidia bacterium]